MRLALYEPDIPQNTGALLRLGACLGLPVDIIEPCGFLLDDKRLRDFLYLLAGAMTVTGGAFAVWPLIDSMNPSAVVDSANTSADGFMESISGQTAKAPPTTVIAPAMRYRKSRRVSPSPEWLGCALSAMFAVPPWSPAPVAGRACVTARI